MRYLFEVDGKVPWVQIVLSILIGAIGTLVYTRFTKLHRQLVQSPPLNNEPFQNAYSSTHDNQGEQFVKIQGEPEGIVYDDGPESFIDGEGDNEDNDEDDYEDDDYEDDEVDHS